MERGNSGVMEGKEWWCWAVVVIHGQGVIVGCVSSPGVCGLSCLWAVVIHWWQVIIVQGWGIAIGGLGVVCWHWVIVGGHLDVVCYRWGSSTYSTYFSWWGAVCGHWVIICGWYALFVCNMHHSWEGLMFMGMGAWLSFVGILMPSCIMQCVIWSVLARTNFYFFEIGHVTKLPNVWSYISF